MVREGQVRGRYFLVGSARSGTTLLQAMLASHSLIQSFPETHFFCELPSKGRRYRWGRLVSRKAGRSVLANSLKVLGREDGDTAPRFSHRYRDFVRAFVRVLDGVTLQAGKSVWLEKTPHHIDFIQQISGSVKGARFIHLVRDGRDVVASQFDAMERNPDVWGKRTIDQMIELWNSDVSVTARYAGNPGHLIISYEDLLDGPEEVLQSCCSFMDVNYEPQMLQFQQNARSVAGWRSDHEYMRNVFGPLTDTRMAKFKALFNPELQEYISRRLNRGGDAKQAIEASNTVTWTR